MTCLVTGAAGFIASRLSRRLIDEGRSVIGIDAFIDSYPKWIKEKNLAPLLSLRGFEFIAGDLATLNLRDILKRCDIIYHMAAQAGVRSSWGDHFSVYTQCNIDATQKLLEAAKSFLPKRFIYASSSSVYGDCPDIPWKEDSPLFPYSPYGVTKLAGENLCRLYYKNFGIPIIALRFFTVYGPGQRPDMAFHKFLKGVLEDREITVYGDGHQTRDFTYVDDIIQACISSMDKGDEGEIYNIGGGVRRKLRDIFPVMEALCGRKIRIKYLPSQKGDVPDTYADIQKAKKDLEYSPCTEFQNGLRSEWDWIRTLYAKHE